LGESCSTATEGERLSAEIAGERSLIEMEGLREDESLTSDIATNESRVNTRSGLKGKKSSPTGNCDRNFCGIEYDSSIDFVFGMSQVLYLLIGGS
jgi:hypothetical protein